MLDYEKWMTGHVLVRCVWRRPGKTHPKDVKTSDDEKKFKGVDSLVAPVLAADKETAQIFVKETVSSEFLGTNMRILPTGKFKEFDDEMRASIVKRESHFPKRPSVVEVVGSANADAFYRAFGGELEYWPMPPALDFLLKDPGDDETVQDPEHPGKTKSWRELVKDRDTHEAKYVQKEEREKFRKLVYPLLRQYFYVDQYRSDPKGFCVRMFGADWQKVVADSRNADRAAQSLDRLILSTPVDEKDEDKPLTKVEKLRKKMSELT